MNMIEKSVLVGTGTDASTTASIYRHRLKMLDTVLFIFIELFIITVCHSCYTEQFYSVLTAFSSLFASIFYMEYHCFICSCLRLCMYFIIANAYNYFKKCHCIQPLSFCLQSHRHIVRRIHIII